MSKPSMCLRHFGYKTTLFQSDRQKALQNAVDTKGLRAVIERLSYVQSESYERMQADIDWLVSKTDTKPVATSMTKQRSDIRLRSFGYKANHPKLQRQESLMNAAISHGPIAVVTRLQNVYDLSKNPTFEEDMKWMVDVLSDKQPDHECDKTSVTKQCGDVKLSSFGYKANHPILQRQESLKKAMISHGPTAVMNRLLNLFALSKNPTFEEDIEWMAGELDDNNPVTWLRSLGYDPMHPKLQRQESLTEAALAHGQDAVEEDIEWLKHNVTKTNQAVDDNKNQKTINDIVETLATLGNTLLLLANRLGTNA